MLHRRRGKSAKVALVAVLVLVAASIPVRAAGHGLGRERSAAAVFGEPVNGLKIGLTVSPVTWKPEGRIRFVCAFRNVSKKPIPVAAWGLELGPVLEVKDSSGKVIRYGGGRNKTRPVPAGAFQTIQPGAIMRFSLTGQLMKNRRLFVSELLGGVWTWQLADGTCTVRAVYHQAPDNEWMQRQAKGDYWKGKVLSAPVMVTVGKKLSKAGEAVNGLKLTLAADKTELKMTRLNVPRDMPDMPPYYTRPTALTFTFTNVSDKPIKLNTYGLEESLIKLDVKGSDADSVRVGPVMSRRRLRVPVGNDYPTMLKPGESWTNKRKPHFPGEFGPLSYALLKPDLYRVKATYACTDRHVKEGKHAKGSWTGSVSSNEVVLKAVAAKPE